MLVAALSTGHKIGLALAGAIFIAFALFSSFVAPRRWPDFPGRALSVFIVASFVLFGLMLASVEVFGVEEEEAGAHEGKAAPEGGGKEKQIPVREREYRISVPRTSAKLAAGTYVFHVVNDGQQVHNVVVTGPGVQGETTPNLQPGKEADLRVKLTKGTYDLFCSIDGHRQLGMEARLSVG